MRKLLVFFLILFNFNLLANPIIIDVPVISEYYYNQGNWQIELCIKSDLYGWMKIQSFDDLSVVSDAGQVPIQTFIQFYYDSVFVIDQSWLSSTLIINPIHDNLNIIWDGWSMWNGISYAPSPDTLVVSSPGAYESIAVQYFGGGTSAYTMKQSPPSIGSNVFEVSSRSGMSGYVYDQYLNPVAGLSLNYYPSLDSKFPQPLHSILTDTNGYFETDEMYPMGYYVELEKNNCILETDMMYFEPDTSYYQEYEVNLTSVYNTIKEEGVKISLYPNPFKDQTSFNIDIPDGYTWDYANILIHNLQGQLLDIVPIANAPWASTDIVVNWCASDAKNTMTNGLYIYTLIVDDKSISSNKMILH